MEENMDLNLSFVDIQNLQLMDKNIIKVKKNNQEKVTNFIKKFGQKLPVITDDNNVIIQGVQVFEACKSLKYKQIAVVKVGSLNEDELYQHAIALNQIVSASELDFEIIKDRINFWFTNEEPLFLPEDLCLSSVEVDSLLFQPVLLEDEKEENVVENPLESIPEIVQQGDLIKLGRHLLFCGDSKDTKSYEILMQNDIANVVITDPPYGCKIRGNVTKQKHHQEFVECSDEPTPEDFINFLTPVVENLKKYSKENSLHYFFMDWRRNYELQTVCKNIFPKFVNLAVWSKKQAGLGSFYRSQHELCFIYQNGTGKHLNNINLGKDGRNRSNIWNYAGMNTSTKDAQELRKLHSTVKPTGMIMDILLDSTNVGDVVLDAFGGSGSTLIAAEETGRKARLVELNPKYCDVIIARWEALTGKKHLKLSYKGLDNGKQ
jgi:DNA modification methylase